MEMGLKFWIHEVEWLRLGIKSHTKEWVGFMSWFPDLKDWDCELSPILWEGMRLKSSFPVFERLWLGIKSFRQLLMRNLFQFQKCSHKGRGRAGGK